MYDSKMEGGGYLNANREPLTHEQRRDLIALLRAQHLYPESSNYALEPICADGPIGPELPPGDWRGSHERRHTWHPRRWRLCGPPEQTSKISRATLEVFCTVYEGREIVSALQIAHNVGREERALEIRRALGVTEPSRW